MVAKNNALVCHTNKKQEILNNLAEVAKKERCTQKYRANGSYSYSIYLRELVKDCKKQGYSSDEIAKAVNVTIRCIDRWLNSTSNPIVKELRIVPDKSVDAFSQSLINKNIIPDTSNKCELVFPSGVKLVMDSDFFNKTISEILFKK